MFWNMGALILGKKSLRSLIKSGKAEPIKVRLKLPKKLNLALPSLIFKFQLLQNGQNAANIGGRRRSVPRDWLMWRFNVSFGPVLIRAASH